MRKQTLDERLQGYEREALEKENCSNSLLYAASAISSVGLLLTAIPSEAAIQYSGIKNQEVNAAQNSFKLDIDGDGSPDFTFNAVCTMSASSTICTQTFSAVSASSGQVIKSNGLPANLGSNYAVSNQRVFAAISVDELAIGNTSVYDRGYFLDRQGYLGVSFKLSGNTHYGWIQYKANANASIGTIVDWAYEDTPDVSIKTGDTGKKFNWNLFLPAIINGNRN